MTRQIAATTCTALVPYDHNQPLVPAKRKRTSVALVPRKHVRQLDTQTKLFNYVCRQLAKRWEMTGSLRADIRLLVKWTWDTPRSRAAAVRNPDRYAQRVHRELLHECVNLGVLR